MIGLSLNDFLLLYVDEINAIIVAWNERETELQKDSWERARASAALTIAPHVKKLPTLRQLMPLPWEDGEAKAPEVGKEDAKERLKSLLAKMQENGKEHTI